jgi:hypothetical protein
MIKNIFKIFYNNIISICYDTQKNSQNDEIIVDINSLNIDHKIQKKSDFYNYLNVLNDNNDLVIANKTCQDTNSINQKCDSVKNEVDYDSNDSEIDEKYDKMSDF